MSAFAARVAVTVAAALALFASGAASASASDVDAKVVGGEQTTIEEWPWQVGIADHPSFGGNGYQRQFCGGSLVAPDIVITAAHCVANSSGNDFVNPNSISAIVGRTRLSSNDPPEIDVDEIWYFVDEGGGVIDEEGRTEFPGVQGDLLFDDNTLEWDAVFLELASPVSDPVSEPIQIAGPDEGPTWAPGQPAWVTGWGSTNPQGTSFPDRLREAQVEMISDSACGSASVYGSEFFAETMVCAGFLEGGVDTCSGDSGGPLVVPLQGGGFRLVGDTSWGFGCAQENAPGVYGRVADNPMRSALADGIQDVASTNVIGSGGEAVPPSDGPPSPAQPLPPASVTPPASNEACEDAEQRLKKAKRKLRKAKKKLKRAKRKDQNKKVKRGKRRVKKKKRKVRKAKKALAACSSGVVEAPAARAGSPRPPARPRRA